MKPALTVCNRGARPRNWGVTARGDDAAMSPLVRNIIVGASLVAFILGAARAVAAIPQVMHAAGMVAPHTWEELLLDTLAATGQ